jgi:hypothetical protein
MFSMRVTLAALRRFREKCDLLNSGMDDSRPETKTQ